MANRKRRENRLQLLIRDHLGGGSPVLIELADVRLKQSRRRIGDEVHRIDHSQFKRYYSIQSENVSLYLFG